MAPCSICDDEITSENSIYNCVGCDLKVHKFCYVISEKVQIGNVLHAIWENKFG